MNSLGVVLSPGGSAGAERSEGERSEPQRSAATAEAGAAPGSSWQSDSEVVAKRLPPLRGELVHCCAEKVCILRI